MGDANEFVEIIKQTAKNVVEASNPSTFLFGTVMSVNPISVSVEQKMTLTNQVILPRHLIEQEIEMTLEGLGEPGDEYVKNGNKKRKVKIHDGLKVGERVVLAQAQGGQLYVVLGRV